MFRQSRPAVVLRGSAMLATLFSLVACLGPSAAHISRPSPADSVNVGYGFQDRRDLTSSVASLDEEAVRLGHPASVADLLDGRFAGVEVQRLGGGRISVLLTFVSSHRRRICLALWMTVLRERRNECRGGFLFIGLHSQQARIERVVGDSRALEQAA